MSPSGVARRIGRGTRKPQNWVQLMQFGVVGASGYVINLSVFAVMAGILDIHHIPAAIIAFCVAVTNNFMWNRHWTFDAGHGHAGFQAAKFLTISVLALLVNLVALELLIGADVAELAAQALAVAIAMPFNFVGNKLWTFDSALLGPSPDSD
jgi:dolichol-phosphate mannosyltransferase